MTWFSIPIFWLIFCANVVHSVKSDIPSLIVNMINEWNEMDPGVHDIHLLKIDGDEPNWSTDVLFNEIAQNIPELNSRILPTINFEEQGVMFRKAAFVIIVSDLVNICKLE